VLLSSCSGNLPEIEPMLDPVVLLTPLLVLVIALLLGFAGCEVGEAPVPLSVAVRVPEALTVTLLQVDWIDPQNDLGQLALAFPQPNSIVEGESRFLRVIQGRPSSGAWSVRCQVAVRDAAEQMASGEATCEFMLSASGPHYVNFRGSDPPFVLTCGGLS
jgi:hypothetical protein